MSRHKLNITEARKQHTGLLEESCVGVTLETLPLFISREMRTHFFPRPLLNPLQEALKKLMIDHHVSHLVTGDILDVCQQFMQRVADKAGMVLLRSLWERPRRELLSLLERSSPPPFLPPSLHPVSCSCPSALSSAPSSFTLLISCCSVEKMGITRARDFVALCGDKALQKLLNLARRNEERDKQRGLENSQELGREKGSLEGKQEGVPGAEGEGREGNEGIVSGSEGHRKMEVIDKEVEETAIDACGEGGEYHSMVRFENIEVANKGS